MTSLSLEVQSEYFFVLEENSLLYYDEDVFWEELLFNLIFLFWMSSKITCPRE